MITDQITDVEIDTEGRLRIRPAEQDLSQIWRAAAEVGWDPETRALYGPKPREWSYATWFQHLVAAARDEYGVTLRLSPETRWLNVPPDTRSAIERLSG